MQKIGVLGAGHLGKIHLKCIQLAQEELDLVGFFDPDPATAEQVSQSLGIPSFETVDDLIAAVDIVDIVTPTITHFELAKKAIQAGRHVFVEKPITHTIDEARQLIALSQEKGLKIQVGHVERFNPAVLALGETTLQPMFIEAHRLATFNPRGTDVSVVLDLMIHDLDIMLSMVNSPVKTVHASGVAVVSDTVDIANARIAFENGCVANLTASRISLKQMRKVRLFQKDAYISLDLLDKKAQVVRLFEEQDQLPETGQPMELDTPHGKKIIHLDMPDIAAVNAIKMELETFAISVRTNARPKVSGEDGMAALALADQIMAVIEEG